MAQRRGSHSRLQSTATNTTTATSAHSQNYSKLRHPSSSQRRVFSLLRSLRNVNLPSSASTSPSSTESRPILAPLQFNLRRLPSRLALADKVVMRLSTGSDHVKVGAKRKRVVSGNENMSNASRASRCGATAFKRRRSSIQHGETSDEEAATAMEVDTHSQCLDSDSSSDGDASDWDSSVDYFVNQAPTRELLRLRKCRLQELHRSAGLSEDPETLTKQEIVDAITSARDELAELPPSSPYGNDGANSSEYSSDDGNVAGGEETDAGSRNRPHPTGLRRHVTVHDVGHTGIRAGVHAAPMQSRSFSLDHARSFSTGADRPIEKRRRATSLRSSPTTSTASSSLPSPPATRLRSRKISGDDLSVAASTSRPTRSRGKTKQVEFSKQVEVATVENLSDLTELSDTELAHSPQFPSPRRLRSQGERIPRTPPKRKGKNKVSSKGEDDDNVDEDVDELISSRDVTPPAVIVDRTPVRHRLRPRRTQTHTPPDESDDGDDEEEEEVVEVVEEGAEDDDASVDVAEEEDSTGADEEDDITLVEPRKLRNGKIVGEEESLETVDEQEGSDESAREETPIEEDIDLEAEDEDEEADESSHDEFTEEAMEDVDLTIATAKSLVRLRRDDLIRLCESRDLDVEGTKPQLAEALLQWRDRQSEGSSPSSAGTIRPPSTARVRRRGASKSKSLSGTPPVLLRTHVHLDEPRTPPLSSAQREKEREEELELDLESLGLDDREIPPDKLTKLEKIGSGGFKDVFIGKFKGRKVAIAEFRGHLTAMDIKELKLLGGFNHPNIVRFLGVSIPEDTRVTPVMIVSELCSNGDLFDYIRNVPPPSLYRVLSIMLDVSRGLEYLHQRKPSVIHRDCKSSNILITSKGIAKIADFGLAKVKQSTRSMVRSLVGTVNWQAPELWHPHPKYNHKVDVFACGAVYWEMLQWHLPNKKYPWEGMNEHAIYEAVGTKRQRPTMSGLRKQWCPEIVDLVERMWAQEHQDRPTMTEAVTELEELVRTYK